MRGIALNPVTPVNVAEPLLDELELLVIRVNPGVPIRAAQMTDCGRHAA
jgi:pentose-5-phosphate-3-epimerase